MARTRKAVRRKRKTMRRRGGGEVMSIDDIMRDERILKETLGKLYKYNGNTLMDTDILNYQKLCVFFLAPFKTLNLFHWWNIAQPIAFYKQMYELCKKKYREIWPYELKYPTKAANLKSTDKIIGNTRFIVETIGDLIERPERLTTTSKEYTYAAEPTRNIYKRMGPMVQGTWIDEWYDVFKALYLMIETDRQHHPQIIHTHVSDRYRIGTNFTHLSKGYDPSITYASLYPNYAPNLPPTKS